MIQFTENGWIIRKRRTWQLYLAYFLITVKIKKWQIKVELCSINDMLADILLSPCKNQYL